MDKNEIIGAIFAILIIFGGITGYNYVESYNDKEMARAGLEQCLETPDWSNSGTIWVKDCGLYMTEWKKVQDD